MTGRYGPRCKRVGRTRGMLVCREMGGPANPGNASGTLQGTLRIAMHSTYRTCPVHSNKRRAPYFKDMKGVQRIQYMKDVTRVSDTPVRMLDTLLHVLAGTHLAPWRNVLGHCERPRPVYWTRRYVYWTRLHVYWTCRYVYWTRRYVYWTRRYVY